MWVIFAGPLTNLIFTLISIPIIAIAFTGFDTSQEITLKSLTWLQYLSIVSFIFNIGMFIFNLLPIYPMDGGRILRALLEHWNVKNHRILSIRITQITTIVLLPILIMNGFIIGSMVCILFFFMSWLEIRTLKREIAEHELAKLVADCFKDGKIDHDELNIKVSEYKDKLKRGILWKETDYKQKHVRYGYESEKDT